MNMVYSVILGSFFCYIFGCWPFFGAMLIMNDEKFDNLPIIRSFLDKKYDGYREIIFYPIISFIGLLTVVLVTLIYQLGRISPITLIVLFLLGIFFLVKKLIKVAKSFRPEN